jgi:hypothetical protein
MSLDIAAVFYNTSKSGETTYMEVVLDDMIKDALIEKFPYLKDYRYSLKEVDRKTENSPVYKITSYKPKQKD